MSFTEIILSGVVAVSTVTYTWITWWALAEARGLRRAQFSPRVIVQMVRDEDGLFQLRIKNVGGGVAEEISFKYDKELVNFRPGQASINSFDSGIPYLAPQDEISIQLVGSQVWTQWDKEFLGVIVMYRGPDGRVHETRNKLHPQAIDSIRMHRVSEIENQLEAIAKSIRSLDVTIARRENANDP